MTTFPEAIQAHAPSQTQTPHNQAWWPEGSDPGGANAGNPPNHVEPSGEGEGEGEGEVKHQKYDAEEAAKEIEKHIPLDRKTASHDAQLKRLENAQASKRSRTRLKTMKEQLDETQKQLDENKIALKLAEERERQEREQRLQAEAENEILRQQLDNKR
ncbi:hypothetical protein E4U23_000229 [Claviceps purpurea]|nr:hypothetical protein E4U23_000229 [Claviceps purpurea]